MYNNDHKMHMLRESLFLSLGISPNKLNTFGNIKMSNRDRRNINPICLYLILCKQ